MPSSYTIGAHFEKFAKDFSAAFVKLLELGVPFDNPGAAAPATPKPSS